MPVGQASAGSHLGSGLLGLLKVASSLGLVDDLQELLGVVGATQGVGEVCVHEQRRELGQHLEVRVCLALGGGDHEHEVCGLAIGSLPVNATGHRHGSKTGLLDGGNLGVRDGNAVAHGRGELCLAGKDPLLVAFCVVDVAARILQGDKLVDGIHLAGGGCADLDALRFEQVSNLHCSPFSFLPTATNRKASYGNPAKA